MANSQNILVGDSAMGLVINLERYFQKAPHIPKNGRQFLAKIAPWLALIGGILTVWGGLTNVGVVGRAGWMMGVLGISKTYYKFPQSCSYSSGRIKFSHHDW